MGVLARASARTASSASRVEPKRTTEPGVADKKGCEGCVSHPRRWSRSPSAPVRLRRSSREAPSAGAESAAAARQPSHRTHLGPAGLRPTRLTMLSRGPLPERFDDSVVMHPHPVRPRGEDRSAIPRAPSPLGFTMPASELDQHLDRRDAGLGLPPTCGDVGTERCRALPSSSRNGKARRSVPGCAP